MNRRSFFSWLAGVPLAVLGASNVGSSVGPSFDKKKGAYPAEKRWPPRAPGGYHVLGRAPEILRDMFAKKMGLDGATGLADVRVVIKPVDGRLYIGATAEETFGPGLPPPPFGNRIGSFVDFDVAHAPRWSSYRAEIISAVRRSVLSARPFEDNPFTPAWSVPPGSLVFK